MSVLANLAHDFLLGFGGVAYILSTFLLPKWGYEHDKLTRFQARKLVHLSTGLVVFITPFFVYPWFAVVGTLVTTTLIALSRPTARVKFFRHVFAAIAEQSEEPKGYLQGPLNYCVTVSVLVASFALAAPALLLVPITAIAVMTVSDFVAAVVGRRWGRHEIHLRWTGTTRTGEGSLAFLVSAFGVAGVSLAALGTWVPSGQVVLSGGQVLLLAGVASGTATLVELLSPSTWDDMTIPLGTTGVLVVVLGLAGVV